MGDRNKAWGSFDLVAGRMLFWAPYEGDPHTWTIIRLEDGNGKSGIPCL